MMRCYPVPSTLPGLLLLAAALAAGCGGPSWTSDSEEAVAAFENCLDARMKFYHREAEEQCARAVEADPDFAIAKLYLSTARRGEERERMVEEVRATDLDELRPRERFLIRYYLEDDPEARREILDGYLEDHPRDPFAIEIECEGYWGDEDWDRAQACLERLLESDPNWVQAQNRLGYISLAQGRFDEAEERFRTYRYVAPDQANPHDSLGELLLLRGRYDEAEELFEQALATRDDFCASYQHLILTHLAQRQAEAARRVVERMEAVEPCRRLAAMEPCRIEIWDHTLAGDTAGAWEASSGPVCENYLREDVFLMSYEAALADGPPEAAARMKAGFERSREEFYKNNVSRVPDTWDAFAAYMAALRAEKAGDPVQAAKLFAKADAGVPYWSNTGTGFFRLFIGLQRAEALYAAGDSDGARRALEEVRAVNPRLVEDTVGPTNATGK